MNLLLYMFGIFVFVLAVSASSRIDSLEKRIKILESRLPLEPNGETEVVLPAPQRPFS